MGLERKMELEQIFKKNKKHMELRAYLFSMLFFSIVCLIFQQTMLSYILLTYCCIGLIIERKMRKELL